MKVFLSATFLCAAIGARAQTPVVPAASQNPSPMAETTRTHARIAPGEFAGKKATFPGPLAKPVVVFIPERSAGARDLSLVIHFLGASYVPEFAATQVEGDVAMAVVHIGAGSGIYDRTFSDPAVFDTLLAGISRTTDSVLGHPARIGGITLSGFSAGHGAIRAILRDARHFDRVNAILLLDGMHTSYVPEGTVIERGGVLDSTNLVHFMRFAREAMAGKKRFLITHSEIFPGTFASTTETADWLLRGLGLPRKPVLEWGPGGMQQLSDVRSGNFEIRGFAGNTAPDHIDQFHGMGEFLRVLLRK